MPGRGSRPPRRWRGSGTPEQAGEARRALVADADVRATSFYAAVLALNAINQLGNASPELKTAVGALPREHESIHERERDYLPRLVEAILEDKR